MRETGFQACFVLRSIRSVLCLYMVFRKEAVINEGVLRFPKFTLLSAGAGFIELGSFTLFNELIHWPYWLSYMTALVL